MKNKKILFLVLSFDSDGNIIDYFKTDNNRKRELRIMAKRFTACVYGHKYKIIRLA